MRSEQNMGRRRSSSGASGRGRKIFTIATVAVLVCTGGAVLGKQLYERHQRELLVSSAIDTDAFYHGIVVQGTDLGGKTMQQAKEEMSSMEPSLRGKYEVTLSYGEKKWVLTQDDLAFSFDTDEVLKQAYAYARTGDREQRYRQVTELKTKPKNYNITAVVSSDGLGTKLDAVAKEINRDPQDAKVASFDAATKTFRYNDGKNGIAVDMQALSTKVEELLKGEKVGSVDVPVTETPFKKGIADVKSNMQQLGTYSTVSTNNAAGTFNMSRALASVNGTSIPAGGTFSFNKTVGNCDAAHGYREAGAILYGKLTKEYGGGICQASTTIYGAALRSNMKITVRQNHSIPSSYCPIGQDATVSYPDLDFQFQNTSAYPVYIVTSTKGKVLSATFYGYQSPDYDEIRVTSQKTETVAAPSAPKYTVDPTLAKGSVRLDAKARQGYRATAERTFYKNGAAIRTEKLSSSYYRPQPAYYSIGKGTDTGKINTGSAKPSTKPASGKPSSSAPSSSKPSSSAPSSTPPASSQEPELPNDDVAVGEDAA